MNADKRRSMHGPERPGYWTAHLAAPNAGTKHQFLEAGCRYRVIRSFYDFDGIMHPESEEWTCLGSSYLPYDDGLSWFVSLDGESEWLLRMQWRSDAQAEVLDNLADYIAVAEHKA